MKIGIAGCGVVGGAVADGLERLGHSLFRHDPALYNTTVEWLIARHPDIIFVCVPTPQADNGDCDTSIVEEVVMDIAKHNYQGIIAIKSTVTPGTTKRLAQRVRLYHLQRAPKIAIPTICFVPEFLRERSSFYDFTEGHDVCVIGTDVDAAYQKIKEAHGRYPKEFIKVSPTEAELCKYFSNVYNALRITFANAFHDVCEKLGADYSKVKSAMVKRPTIEDIYLDCNNNFRGFAGVCLPKDTSAFASLAKSLEVKAQIFSTIVEDNKLYKPTVFGGMRME